MADTTEARRRRLVVNADDFAFSPAVTDGILEAHRVGSVTSTSMLVGCAGWEHGVRQARATPALGIGLHFNLLVGAPLIAAPSIMGRDGRFPSLPALVLRALRRAVDPHEVAAECEAQLAALAGAGIRVTHIDSHRHVHALPMIHGAVAAVAVRHGLFLRRPMESASWFPFDLAAQLHKAQVAAAWIASAGGPAPRTTDHFVGISLQGGTAFGRRLSAVLDRIGGGTTELMVHPGRVDAALESPDRYTWQRELELAALISPAVRDRLQRGDLDLVGFGSL